MTIDASARARVLGIETRFQPKRGGVARFLPQRIYVIAQGTTAAVFPSEKFAATSEQQVGSIAGFGSPAHLIAEQLLPANGDGVGSIPVTFALLDDAGGATPSDGDITPSGTATQAHTVFVRANGILSEAITIPAGAIVVADVVADIVAAANAVLRFPMIAADGGGLVADFTSKWAGASANDLVLEVVDAAGKTPDFGVAFAITQPVGGATNPDVQPAIDQIGTSWETMVINAMDIADTTTLDAFQVWGEGRWGDLERKPAVVFTGNTIAAVAAAFAVATARPLDRVNSQLVAPGSVNLPFVVAARQVARVARLANNDPAHDYGSQRADGLLPGADGDQWDYAERDLAVKNGSSTVEIKDGVINVSDVVTFWRPTGEEPPAYSHVVDVVKLQNILYNIGLEFDTQEWDGAPMVPDNQPTTHPTAKTPNMAIAAIRGVIDALAAAAIISDPEAAKESVTAEINASNPKRIDFVLAPSLSGNTNIKSGLVLWSFFFGGA